MIISNGSSKQNYCVHVCVLVIYVGHAWYNIRIIRNAVLCQMMADILQLVYYIF